MSNPTLSSQMQVVGILTMHTEPNGDQIFVVHNPERVILALPLDRCPDDWLSLARDIQKLADTQVLAVLVDVSGPATNPTHNLET